MLIDRIIRGRVHFLDAPGGAGAAGAGAGDGGGSAGGSAGGGAAGAGAAPGAVVGDKPAWGDNWRESLSMGDEKRGELLKRYAAPTDFAKAHFDLTDKVAKGELRAPPKPLPPNATDEQRMAWRKERGVPEAPQGYIDALKFSDGTVLPDADKQGAALQAVAKAAHDAGVEPDQFNWFVGQYYKARDAEAAGAAERRQANANAFLMETGKLWGSEAPANLKQVETFSRNVFGAELFEKLRHAQMADGSYLLDSVPYANALLAMAKHIDPDKPFISGTGDAGGVDPAARLKELRGWASAPTGSDNWRRYWKGEEGKRHQEEYRRLLVATGKAARS